MYPNINPFQNQMFQNYMMQAPQNAPYQPAGISGKYVNDFNEITANDVPMNGSPSVFLKNDRSEIQIREWNPNGQIVPRLYRAVEIVEQAPQDPKDDYSNLIIERLTALEDKIDKLSKAPARARKETEC